MKTIAAVGLICFSAVGLSGCGCKTAPAENVEKITIWGLFDEPEAYDKAILAYKNEHKNVKEIEYKKFPCNESECYDYLREVIQGLAAGNGPDIFMINNTWVPAQKDKMLELDAVNAELEKKGEKKIMTLRDYGDTFVPVARKDFVYKEIDGTEKIYAVPMWMDNLAVFYNRDLFNIANITPPPKNWTWQQLESQAASFEGYVTKMTKIDEYGGIKKSGASIGYGKNVDRAPDILAVLMMQMGSDIVGEEWEATLDSRISVDEETSFSAGESALAFYTKFADRRETAYTWNKEMWNSVDGFYAGNVGMMINYSHRIKNIQEKAPNLNVGIAHLPQMRENSKPVNFASYWGFAVSKQATGQKAFECWNFLKFLTSKEQSELYSQENGKLSPRLDVLPKQKEDQWLGVFADQAASADSYRQSNNARVGFILESAINSVVDQGVMPADAAATASEQINQEGHELYKKLRGENF